MAGDLTYWFNGLPIGDLSDTVNDPGSLKYWFNGLPAQIALPDASPAANVPGGVALDASLPTFSFSTTMVDCT